MSNCNNKDPKDLTPEEKYEGLPDYVKAALKDYNQKDDPSVPLPPVHFEPPSLAQKIHNIVDFAKTVARDKFDGKNMIAEDEKFNSRMNTCMSCKYLSEDKTTCNECGCILQVKLKFESASCPKGYW